MCTRELLQSRGLIGVISLEDRQNALQTSKKVARTGHGDQTGGRSRLTINKRADERTRTAYPCSLRVIHQALQGCARDCKCPINRRLSLLRVAECCTVLRSRWYQSGI